MGIPLLSWLFLISICLLSINFCISAVCGQCLDNQQSLLLQLKDSLVFDRASSTKLVHWNQSVDCCSWEGVTCNEGRVMGLDLTNEAISGGLDNSSSLFSLQYLQNLSLASNNFSGTLPHSIGNLKMLSSIDISVCNFSGEIPNSMANLTQLLYLDMSFNNFVGSIPSFSMGKKLTTIDISNNNLTGEITSTRWEELLNLEVLDLSYNSLEGNIPISLFSLPSLRKLKLLNNRFSGQLIEFSTVSSYLLEYLDLSHNNLERPIPMSVFELRRLEVLSLSWNNFSGSLQLNVIRNMRYLSYLDLSHNNLVIENNETNSLLSVDFPPITTIILASNNLKTFPYFLINLSALLDLDLSGNQIHGNIPNWIWKLPKLYSLNLSYNHLETLDLPFLNVSSVSFLDLQSNHLQGQLSVFPKDVKYLDFSKNNFSSAIPVSIGDSLSAAYFFSLSSNKFYGSIPRSICNATDLRVLDLSDNFFSGTVPKCLFKMIHIQRTLYRQRKSRGSQLPNPIMKNQNFRQQNQLLNILGLGVLNLKRNNLTGAISNTFPIDCALQTLNLNGNQLEGRLPKSLANCISLKVLDLGNNHIENAFPCYLKNISTLQVLVLRSNKFYGPIDCLGPNASWSKLQIVDLATNNFTGKLPIKYFSEYFSNWKATQEFGYQLNELHVECGDSDTYPYQIDHMDMDIHYRDVVTVTMKGVEAELVKISTIFTSLDFSCNKFEGPIPEEVGELKSLYILNLSHNAFTGQIPQSLGKLTYLESLDLSNNMFTGEIPVQLADGLIFLSFLNLSFNQLEGKIPQIKQFDTFSETSYEGNRKLCGFPLKKKCRCEEPGLSPLTSEETYSNSRNAIDWNIISAELGFVFGLGIVIGPLMFWKRWRICYYKHVDDIFFKMFPRLYIIIENCQR